MSGVKNLRAMFEQKGETSPPDRGRSPGIPWTPSDSPRPLSKVRTNFIAIEKDGRIGLQRETSQDSIISASRKLSGGSSDAPTPPAIKQDTDVFGANVATAAPPKMNLKEQPIPESPRTETGGPITNDSLKGKTESKPQPPSTAAPQPKKSGSDAATDEKQATSNGSGSKAEPSGKHLNGVDHSKGKDKGPSKDRAPSKDSRDRKEAEKTQAKSSHTKPTPKPLAPSATKTAKPAKSPTTAKIPKTPTEMSAAKLPAKTPDKAQPKEKAATPRTAGASSKATGPSSIKRPPPLQASPGSGTGFVKPKPKSPTRPIDLPARLTTHTAASVSKVNGGSRQSLAPTSSAAHTTDTVGRSPSRTSVSTATSGPRLNVVKSLKRQNSTINRPRPSLGPPPKLPAKDHPPTKKEKEVDESFLARMTRPTQAFASKTVGKVPASPPRKVTAAPTAKKPAHKPEPHGAKKTTLPHRPKASAGSSSQQPEASAAANIAIRVEEVATAEEAIDIAKSVENAALPSPEVKADPAPVEEAAKPVEEVTEDAHVTEAAPSSPLASPQTPVDQPDLDDGSSQTPASQESAEPASDDKITVEVASEDSGPAQESVLHDGPLSHEKVEPAESAATTVEVEATPATVDEDKDEKVV